jgi:RNA polymerase sigma factor (sigma-70 family)
VDNTLTPGQEALVLRHRGYAENVAKVAARGLPLAEVGMTVDDCVQLGLLGLTQAARRFDITDHDYERATVDARFRSYSYLRIRGAVIDECRRLGGEKRKLPPPTLSFDHHEGAESLSFDLDDADDWIDLRMALDQLDRRDRSIAVLLMHGVPLTEIAPKIGVTEGRMHAIAKDIRSRLAEKAGVPLP